MDQAIGELEHDLHTAFASKRVASESFVYVQDEAVFSALDEFCSDSTFLESREPLVLYGPSGGGKSAALSNWLAQRRHLALRKSRGSKVGWWWRCQPVHVHRLCL